jgi:hypothetical protein
MLSRHERDRVDGMESRIEELARRVDRAEARSEVYESQYAALLSTHNEALKAFQKVADQYTDGLSRARETIAELSKPAEPQSAFQNRPLHKSEEEEDLEFQLDHGVLNLAQYNEALRAAGLSDD